MFPETGLWKIIAESNLLNFGLALAVLVYFLTNFLPKSAKIRKSELEQEIAQAQKLKDEAEAKLGELEKEIDRAKAESTRIINTAKATAEDIKNATIQNAQAEITKLNTNAQKEIEMQRVIAIESLRKEIAATVISGTEKALKEKQIEFDSLIKDKVKKDLAKI